MGRIGDCCRTGIIDDAKGWPLVYYTHTDKKGYNYLHLACQFGHESAVKFFSGIINTDNLSNEGQNCLHVACKYGKLEPVKYLLPKMNALDTDDDGNTLLHYACRSGNEELVEYLKTKIDVNIVNDFGRTCIHETKNPDVIKVLRDEICEESTKKYYSYFKNNDKEDLAMILGSGESF